MAEIERWRNIIDKALPRADLMEIPWHEVPEMWRKDYEELAVSPSHPPSPSSTSTTAFALLTKQHPETPDEEAFIQRFGRSIELVYKTLVRYRSTRSVGYINTAYTEIYKLFGDLDAGIAQQYKIPNAKLSMQNTAPKLLMLKDCILTVPGTPSLLCPPLPATLC
jgi:FKBP12-rapamycin complex-associated protein